MMPTTREDISRWYDEGLRRGASHLVVVCDTFDWYDYPVYCGSLAEAQETVKSPGEMQRVMEVYRLDPETREEQLSARRSWSLF